MKFRYLIIFISLNFLNSQSQNLYPNIGTEIMFQPEWAKKLYYERIELFKRDTLKFNQIVFLGNSITEGGKDWNEKFLQKTLKNLWCSVKAGGYLLVNISDVYSNSKWSTERGWLEICNPMNDFLSTFTDSEYQGCIGMELAKRPNSGGAGTAKSDDYSEESLKKAKETKDKTFCEPIWIWRKI